MDYKTLILTDVPHGISVTLNRIEQRNALNSVLLSELHQVLDQAEKNPDCKMITLKGQKGVFCTGMDFNEAIKAPIHGEQANQSAQQYMLLLKRFAASSKIIIAVVDGQVMAGGVGLVAASDIVIATSQSRFVLSEALWGLLPANVLPYLIRRIGFQKSYLMTLTCQTLSAVEAHAAHLVDELSDDLDETWRKYMLNLIRLDEKTVIDLKQYFRKLWIINENIEQMAMHELARLMQEPRVQNNIKRFIEENKFPWQVTHD